MDSLALFALILPWMAYSGQLLFQRIFMSDLEAIQPSELLKLSLSLKLSLKKN